MFCGNCGAENVNGAKFCKGCGQALNETGGIPWVDKVSAPQGVSSKSVESNIANNVPKVNVNQLIEKIKSMPKKVLVGVCVAVIALIIIICVAVNARSTINLNDYLTIETNGYDGYGTVIASIDWSAIEQKYGDKIAFTSKAKNEYGGFIGMMTPIDALQDAVSVEMETTNNMSNGDAIKYSWKIDEDLSTYIKCKIKYKDDSYSVSGLKEIETFDPFDGVEVDFTGIAPGGMVEIVNYPSDNGLSYELDKYNGVSNGDSVTVNVSYGWSSEESYAEQYGKLPTNTSKEFTVSGLEEYVADYEDLSEEFISKLKDEAEDSIYSYTADSYSTSSSLTDLMYSGYILNAIKDGSEYANTYNDLYIIYSGTVSSSNGSFSTAKVYFPVRFVNILNGENGLRYSENYGITGNSRLDDSWSSTKGYINPLICYMEIVEANKDSYIAECGDGFEKYAEYEAITKLDDIAESFKEELYVDAKDRIENYIASFYNGSSSASDLSIAGEYLLTAKIQGPDLGNNNKYFVVYSATVTNSEGGFDTTTVYFPVEYDGIIKLPGDEYMVTSSAGIVGNSSFPNSYYSTDGYIDGNEMYTKIITANRDNYTYEVSEELKVFGE